jgi:CRP-like cAMP-binding protein/rhodanese-related sulfurtransferase
MDEKSKMVAAIAGSNLFGNISKEAIEALAGIAHKIILPPDSFVVRQGDIRSNCYIIASGQVKLIRAGRAGQEYEFEQLGRGESFEEVALLTDGPSSMTVRTVQETCLIVIPRDQFNPIMIKYPNMASAIGKGISRWLSGARSVMESSLADEREVPRAGWFDYMLIIGLSVLCVLTFNISNPKGIPLIPKSFSEEMVPSVTPSDALKNKQKGSAILIDARPSESYAQERIAGAESLPLAIFDFMYDLNLGRVDKSKKIIIYGRTISKLYDEEVAKKLVARGHTDVQIMTEGLDVWKKKGYPVAP